MRYCIGCIHLYYTPAEDGYNHSSWTNSPGSPAELSCLKGHWENKFTEFFSQEAFQKAMETAETCSDFKERTHE